MTDTQPHDWPPEIARNRAALLRFVAALVVYAGLDEGGAGDVPRRVWRRIMRLLRLPRWITSPQPPRIPGLRAEIHPPRPSLR